MKKLSEILGRAVNCIKKVLHFIWELEGQMVMLADQDDRKQHLVVKDRFGLKG